MEAIFYRLFLITICIYSCWCGPTTEPPTTLAEPSQLDNVQAMLGHLQKTLQTLMEDVNLIKSDQQAMKADIDRIKRDQQDLKLEIERMDRVKTDKQSARAEMDQMKKDQEDLKNYLMQRNKAMEEKIVTSLTTRTKKTQDRFQLLATIETLEQFQYRKDFTAISTRVPSVHQDCMEAYSDGWENSGWYTINPDGRGNIKVYCEQEIAGGGWTLENETDFRPMMIGAAKSPPVFKNCSDAEAQGWTSHGWYRINPDGRAEHDVYCKVWRDCQDAYDHLFRESGVYQISPDNTAVMNVYCEQEFDGGGWTVFQRRINGEVDFYRGWQEYKTGFGNVSTEFWLGNDALYHLTKHKDQVLKIELTHPNGEVAYADYSEFYIDNETEKYRLHVSGFSGANPPGDAFAPRHSGKKFTTKDSDNDNERTINCAQSRLGAWWYSDCHHSNLNGKYNGNDITGIHWRNWGDTYSVSMKQTRMMTRKKGMR